MGLRKVSHTGAVQALVLVLSLMAALVVGALLLLLVGADPLKAYVTMFCGPLRSRYGVSELLVRATPLLLVSLGIVLSFRTGVWNIGGEGQLIAGAVAGTALALGARGWPAWVLLPLVLVVGAVAGALWGAVAGLLKTRLSVNEILSTIMLNQIALHLCAFLIRGPMIDPKQLSYGTGYPQTALIPQQIWLPRFPGTRAHVGFVLALMAAVLVHVLLVRTVIGYRMRAVGASVEAARYAGIGVNRYVMLAIAVSGGFAGLAGIVEVLGVHHRLLDGVSAGYGFSGIVVALFARLHPLACIPAALFFGLLVLGADMMQRAVAVPGAIALVMEGLIVLFVVGGDLLVRNPELAGRLAHMVRVRRPKGVTRPL